MPVGEGGGAGRQESPLSYFPRSFTISKKYPGLGENISRVQGVQNRGSTARGVETRIRTSSRQPGRAKPGGRRRRPAARVASPVAPGGQDSFLSFTSGLPSLRFRKQILLLDRVGKGARLHGPPPPQPPRKSPARVRRRRVGGLRSGGQRGRGGEGRRAGPRPPESAGGGEVREAALPSPPGRTPPVLLFTAAA